MVVKVILKNAFFKNIRDLKDQGLYIEMKES
jgi:hypothetical protein